MISPQTSPRPALSLVYSIYTAPALSTPNQRYKLTTYSQHGVYKTGIYKTLHAVRRGQDRMDNSYGCYLRSTVTIISL